jgi:hypothetical protein
LVVEKTKGKKKKTHVKHVELVKKWLSVGGGYNQILPNVDGQALRETALIEGQVDNYSL